MKYLRAILQGYMLYIISIMFGFGIVYFLGMYQYHLSSNFGADIKTGEARDEVMRGGKKIPETAAKIDARFLSGTYYCSDSSNDSFRRKIYDDGYFIDVAVPMKGYWKADVYKFSQLTEKEAVITAVSFRSSSSTSWTTWDKGDKRHFPVELFIRPEMIAFNGIEKYAKGAIICEPADYESTSMDTLMNDARKKF